MSNLGNKIDDLQWEEELKENAENELDDLKERINFHRDNAYLGFGFPRPPWYKNIGASFCLVKYLSESKNKEIPLVDFVIYYNKDQRPVYSRSEYIILYCQLNTGKIKCHFCSSAAVNFHSEKNSKPHYYCRDHEREYWKKRLVGN